MKLLSLNTVALALIVLGVSGMIVPTGAVSGGGADRVWDEPAISLEPASGPNGEYAQIGANGNLSVDLSTVNAEAVTVVREVFTITNHEDDTRRVWVSHDAEDAVQFFIGGSRSIQDPDNPLVLDAGETRPVSLRIDTRGHSAGETLMTTLTLHAERVATPSPTAAPEPTPTTTPEPTPTETPTPSPTESPTPSPEPTVEETVEVVFDFEPDREPTTGTPTEPTEPKFTVREMNVTELDEDPDQLPRARIDRTEEAETAPETKDPTLGVKGAEAVTEVGKPVNLSGTRSLIGQVDGVDSERRIAKMVDIQVPEERRGQPGVVRITVARSKLGDTDPQNATIGHKTKGGWQLLNTRVASTTEQTVTLQARTPSFSPFAVFVDNEVRYDWTLPDGSTVPGKEIRSEFDKPGVYNVSLTVTDALGRSDTANYRVLVNDRPTVTIEGLANASDDGPTTLRANVTDEVGNVTVTWTFADGSTTTGETVTRELEAGETVRVLVEDEFGAQGRAEGIVGQATGDAGQPALGVVQFNLGLQTRIAVVGLGVILLITLFRWLAARRYDLS